MGFLLIGIFIFAFGALIFLNGAMFVIVCSEDMDVTIHKNYKALPFYQKWTIFVRQEMNSYGDRCFMAAFYFIVTIIAFFSWLKAFCFKLKKSLKLKLTQHKGP